MAGIPTTSRSPSIPTALGAPRSTNAVNTSHAPTASHLGPLLHPTPTSTVHSHRSKHSQPPQGHTLWCTPTGPNRPASSPTCDWHLWANPALGLQQLLWAALAHLGSFWAALAAGHQKKAASQNTQHAAHAALPTVPTRPIPCRPQTPPVVAASPPNDPDLHWGHQLGDPRLVLPWSDCWGHLGPQTLRASPSLVCCRQWPKRPQWNKPGDQRPWVHFGAETTNRGKGAST